MISWTIESVSEGFPTCSSIDILKFQMAHDKLIGEGILPTHFYNLLPSRNLLYQFLY